MSGKVVVITGAASGIGAAAAKRLVDEGARLLKRSLLPWEVPRRQYIATAMLLTKSR